MSIFGKKDKDELIGARSGNQRILTPALESELLDMIPPGSEVHMYSILGNAEAYRFATEIKEYLRSRGYTADGVNQAVYTDPVDGQIIEPPEDGGEAHNIIIGNKL